MNQTLPGTVPAVAPPLDLYGPIAADLDEVERILARVLTSRYEAVSEVVAHVRHYRGKRLRPVLLLLSARACGRVTPAHHTLGAVVEMIHTATLVHDDVLDGAGVRRHVPTVNARWGNHTSVLMGDYLFTHAFHLASTLDDVRACRLIGAATNRVCEGEMCQGLQRGDLDLGEDDYFDVIDGKTAELIACCCHLGALFSGASPEVVSSLTRFGRCVGLAFQIADDVLDLVGDEHATGKSLGTDLEQQKMTLPLIRLLAEAPQALAERVRHVLCSPVGNKRELLKPLLAQSDGVEYARRRAEELAARARKELTCLPPSACRSILEAITERVVYRNT
jgi:octaprenyl-diphosphate synthase